MPTISSYNYCLYLLAKREYSQQELRCKLKQRQIQSTQIDNCLLTLQQRNLQSDQRYCDSMLRYHSGQGKGPNWIKQKCLQAGITASMIEQSLMDCQIDWLDILQQLIDKKFCNQLATDWSAQQKQKRYLLSRGFSYQQIDEFY